MGSGWRCGACTTSGRNPWFFFPPGSPMTSLPTPSRVDPPLRLAPGGSTLLELPVACNELPGSVVENAFVILRLLWLEQPWRAFVRLRVTVDNARTPQYSC